MGARLREAFAAAPDLLLAAEIDPGFGGEGQRGPAPAGRSTAGQSSAGSPVRMASLAALAPGSTDVVVEFTKGDVPAEIGPEVRRLGCGWVCGTTGLTPESRKALDEAAAAVPVLWAPNMSLGAALLSRLCAEAARLLPADWELEIVETHHGGKLDAPSGTAMALAETWTRLRGGKLVYGRSGRTGPRPPAEVGVHAVRLPEGTGEHRLLLGGPAESLELVHRAHDRAAFAIGALTAARWINRRSPGFYTLDDWLKERLAIEAAQ